MWKAGRPGNRRKTIRHIRRGRVPLLHPADHDRFNLPQPGHQRLRPITLPKGSASLDPTLLFR
jgi:hypothetical protein